MSVEALAAVTPAARLTDLAIGRKVIVVDDGPDRSTLVEYLAATGFDVLVADHWGRGNDLIEMTGPDLILVDLDLDLDPADGTSTSTSTSTSTNRNSILHRLRSTTPTVGIIATSRRSAESELIAALLAGADDYIPKPVSPREVVARALALLRRSRAPIPGAAERSTIAHGDLVINGEGRTVLRADEPVPLTPREFDLLWTLAARAGRVFSRAELLALVWGSSPDWQDPGTVTVHIRRLRRKIEVDPENPRHLRTVYGCGYRFDH